MHEGPARLVGAAPVKHELLAVARRFTLTRLRQREVDLPSPRLGELRGRRRVRDHRMIERDDRRRSDRREQRHIALGCPIEVCRTERVRRQRVAVACDPVLRLEASQGLVEGLRTPPAGAQHGLRDTPSRARQDVDDLAIGRRQLFEPGPDERAGIAERCLELAPFGQVARDHLGQQWMARAEARDVRDRFAVEPMMRRRCFGQLQSVRADQRAELDACRREP